MEPTGAESLFLSPLDANTLRYLVIAIRILLAGSIALLLAQVVIAPAQPLRAVGPGMLAPMALAILWLIRRDRVVAALKTLIFGSWLILALATTVNGGFRSPGVYGYPVIVIMAGWLVSRRGALWVTALTFLLSGAWVVAEQARVMPQAPYPPSGWTWIAFSLILAVATCLALMVAGRHVFRYRSAAQQSEELAVRLDALKVLQEALAASEAHHRALYEGIPSVYLTADEHGRILSINPAGARQLGWSAPELIGRDLRAIVAPTMHAKIDEQIAACVANPGEIQRSELRQLRRDGSSFWAAESAWTMAGSRVVHVLCDDISAHKQAEAELRVSEERFAKMFRASPVAISLTRIADGCYLDVNDAYVRRFGWPREELIGRTSIAVGLWANEAERTRWRDALLGTGTTRDFEVRMYNKTGELRHVLISAERVELDGSESVLALLYDITERKSAEDEVIRLNAELETRVHERTEELLAANKELESFAYSVSHDLRSPLRGIDGFSQVLLEDYGARLDERGREHLGRVRRAAQRLGNLIDDLLDLSRVTRQEMRRERVDLSAIALEVLEDLRHTDAARAVETHIESSCVVRGDPQLLRILMENLINNAWKYTGRTPSGRIEFGCERVGGERVFKLSDNGAGFDMAYADRLFLPFERLHRPDEFEGSGIGLASAARVVSRHGGRIWAEAAVARGATFRFTLGRAAD